MALQGDILQRMYEDELWEKQTRKAEDLTPHEEKAAKPQRTAEERIQATLNLGAEETAAQRKELGQRGMNLSQEYKTRKQEIETSRDYTDQAKGRLLNELYNEYAPQIKKLIAEQNQLDAVFYKERREKAEQLLQKAEKDASLDNFSEKDMAYILYVAEHGSNQTIQELVEKYDFNPFLIRLLNIRDEKKPVNERLKLVHPLQKVITEAKENNIGALRVAMANGVELPHRVEDLLPSRNVPKLDEWSSYKTPQQRWGDA